MRRSVENAETVGMRRDRRRPHTYDRPAYRGPFAYIGHPCHCPTVQSRLDHSPYCPMCGGLRNTYMSYI
jgi:hypothetical protein